MKSLTPPKAEKSQVGQVWVSPITTEKYIFNGEQWEPWTLENARALYEKGEK